MINKTTIKVLGMSCEHCEKSVEKAVLSVNGIHSAKAYVNQDIVEIESDGSQSAIKAAKDAIIDEGYDVAI